MTQKSFYDFISVNNIAFVESTFYFNNPGIYGIIIYPDRFVSYKNFNENVISQSPTEWAKECSSIENAYNEICNHYMSLKNEDSKTK